MCVMDLGITLILFGMFAICLVCLFDLYLFDGLKYLLLKNVSVA